MTLTWTTIQPTSPLSQQSQPTNKNFESAWPQSELALAQPSNHSKMCLSTSWNASLADSSCDCAAKYFRSVWWRFFLTQSSISLLAMLYSKSRRRRLSRYDFMFLLLITWHLNGFIMLKSISLRSLAMALWGASALVMAFVASFILQQSAFIKGSSTAASPVVVLSAKTTKPSARLSTPVGDFNGIIPDSHWSTGRKQHLASFRWVFHTDNSTWGFRKTKEEDMKMFFFFNSSWSFTPPFMKTSTFLKISCKVTSNEMKSFTIPSKTGSTGSPAKNRSLRTFHSIVTADNCSPSMANEAGQWRPPISREVDQTQGKERPRQVWSKATHGKYSLSVSSP